MPMIAHYSRKFEVTNVDGGIKYFTAWPKQFCRIYKVFNFETNF